MEWRKSPQELIDTFEAVMPPSPVSRYSCPITLLNSSSGAENVARAGPHLGM
jgi:hypothetical protein